MKHKKSLGQHFLSDDNLLKKIADSADLTKEDLVLEVGTGLGTLTKHIARSAGFVVSVELDKNIIARAQENLKGFNNIEFINENIMKLNIPDIMDAHPSFKRRKVVANIPYYITTPLISMLIESKADINTIVLLIQKEVADRIVAAPGGKKYGSLTIYVNYYCEPKIEFRIPRTAFVPPPEVDSAVLKLVRRGKPPVDVKDEKLFFRIVRGAFVQRRKMLRNAIMNANIEGVDKEKLDKAFADLGIDGKRRGETLSIKEFAELADRLTS